MNIKKIESLLTQIENATYLTIDDSPKLMDVTANWAVGFMPELVILQVTWNDESGMGTEIFFTEQNLDNANFIVNQIRLDDKDGNKRVITLYESAPCIVVKNW